MKIIKREDYNPNQRMGFEGSTLLHQACKSGYKEICEDLLKKGADIEAQDKFGTRAIHTASKSGHAHIVSLLLQNGAKVNAKDNDGNNSMHFAAF